jgi:hypothetical protein
MRRTLRIRPDVENCPHISEPLEYVIIDMTAYTQVEKGVRMLTVSNINIRFRFRFRPTPHNAMEITFGHSGLRGF